MLTNRFFLTSAAIVVVAAMFIVDGPDVAAARSAEALRTTAVAVTSYFFDPPGAATTGNWNDSANWRDSCGGSAAGGYPSETTDSATICSGNTVTVNEDVDVASITVESTAAMAMSSTFDVTTGTLTVSGGSDNRREHADGHRCQRPHNQ